MGQDMKIISYLMLMGFVSHINFLNIVIAFLVREIMQVCGILVHISTYMNILL